MFPLPTRARRHDDEVDLSANANRQPPQPQLPLPQVEVPSPPPRPPQAKPMVPRHVGFFHTRYQLSARWPCRLPLAGRVQNASNTLLEPRVPTAPTVPVVSTSVLPHETPRSLLTDPHPHPSSHFVSSLPARGPAPSPTSPAGSIIAPLAHHATSYNHLESWNVVFADMELESEAQLLNALPVPIRPHPAQSYASGTGIVDTHGQTDARQGAPMQIQYPQQATPVYSEYSFAHDSTYTYMSVPAQPHRYHQQKPAPAPAPAPALLSLDTCRDSAVSVLLPGSTTTDTARCATNAGNPGLIPAPPTPTPMPLTTILPQPRLVSRAVYFSICP